MRRCKSRPKCRLTVGPSGAEAGEHTTKGPEEYPPKPQFGLLAPAKAISGNTFLSCNNKNMQRPRFQTQHSCIKPHWPLWSGL